jgi:hypothetical protein
MKLKLTYH